MQEFDIIQQNTVSVRGNFIEYTAISQAESAIRYGDDKIDVRADGVFIGSLIPGESLRIQHSATRWEITATNYARVRIGVGSADFVASRGIIKTEPYNRTTRGSEFVIAARSTVGETDYAYVGLYNNSTDKSISISSITVNASDATADIYVGFANIVAPAFVASPVFNRHSDFSGDSSFIKIVAGKTLAFEPTAGEMAIISETAFFAQLAATRTVSFSDGGSPIIITPGKSLITRVNAPNKPISLKAHFSALSYGPR